MSYSITNQFIETNNDPTDISNGISLHGTNYHQPGVYSTTVTLSVGNGEMTAEFDLDTISEIIHIKINAPSDHWFGMGIDTSRMEGTDAWVNVCSEVMVDRTLGNHNPGTVDPQNDLNVTSHSVENNRRVIEFHRPFNTTEPGDVVIAPGKYSMIFAIGMDCTFAYHGSNGRAITTLDISLDTSSSSASESTKNGSSEESSPNLSQTTPQNGLPLLWGIPILTLVMLKKRVLKSDNL